MDIKKQLEELLEEIDMQLSGWSLDSETRATLRLAKSNTLMALQKYEDE